MWYLQFYISFSGNITFKNAKNANKCISAVPIEKQLIETDSPYITPEPFRGKKNSSKYIPYIAQKVAEILNISVEEVARKTTSNACDVFDLTAHLWYSLVKIMVGDLSERKINKN